MQIEPHTRQLTRRSGAIAVALALALGATACEPAADDAPATDPDSPAGDATAPGTSRAPAPPDTGPTVDTLLLEGSPEPISVRSWSTPEDFPLPFITRLPERVQASADVEAGESWARFEFAGAPDDEVFMHFLVLDQGLTEGEAISRARAVATDFGPVGSQGIEYSEGENAPEYDWALTSYGLRGQAQGERVTGSLSLGRHDSRYFTVMRLYPPEYADGVGPRFHYILERLRWSDTGRGLRLERRPPNVVDPASAGDAGAR